MTAPLTLFLAYTRNLPFAFLCWQPVVSYGERAALLYIHALCDQTEVACDWPGWRIEIRMMPRKLGNGSPKGSDAFTRPVFVPLFSVFLA